MKSSVIAEIGWNHMGDNELAVSMIHSAKDSGSDIIKFQYWDPQSLKPGPWDSDGRRQIYEKAALNKEKIIFLKRSVEEIGCEFLISVFGTKGAQFIKELGIENIKIPSHEIANTSLIEYCASNFNSIYLSAGAATSEEVIKSVEILKSKKSNFILMHCVSSYPCPEANINLPRLEWLKTLHNKIGFSDHTEGTLMASLALTYGASVIEKHFTTDKDLPGRDNKFALDPEEFKIMTQQIELTKSALLDHGKEFQDLETDTMENYRGRWEPHDYA